MSISVHLSSGDILVTEAEEKNVAFQSQTSYKPGYFEPYAVVGGKTFNLFDE